MIYKDIIKRYYKKVDMIIEFAKDKTDYVVSVSPVYDYGVINHLKSTLKDAHHIHLTCTPKALFKRLKFYDELGRVLLDSDEYKYKHEIAYLYSCKEDIELMNYYLYRIKKLSTTKLDVEQVVSKVIDIIESES